MDLDAVGSATAKFTGVLQHFIYHSDQLGEKVHMPRCALTGRFLDWWRLVGRNRGVLEERVPFLTSTGAPCHLPAPNCYSNLEPLDASDTFRVWSPITEDPFKLPGS